MANLNFIDEERDVLLKERGKYLYIPTLTGPKIYETSKIINEIVNPFTGKKMSSDTILYIQFHWSCYWESIALDKLTSEKINDCFAWYHNLRKKGISYREIKTDQKYKENFNIVRHYLTPTDFQEHFKNFDPNDSEAEAYERDLAEKALQKSQLKGSWLIRHSSKNRSDSINNYTRYYAISYLDLDNTIRHFLISKVVGIGWRFLENDEYSTFTNFLECLEYVLTALNLEYSSRISVYVEPDFFN